MVERQVEPLAKVIERLLRLFVVGEQRQSRLDFHDAWRAVVPLNPGSQQLPNFLELLRVEQVQSLVIVIIVRPRNELFERNGSIGSQGEIFDKADFSGPRGRADGHPHHREQDETTHFSFLAKPCDPNDMRRSSRRTPELAIRTSPCQM